MVIKAEIRGSHKGPGYELDFGGESPPAQVLSLTAAYVAVKTPGHAYWAARGRQGYAPPEVSVYAVQDAVKASSGRKWLFLTHEIGWEAGRKPPLVKMPEELEELFATANAK